jgi:G3E family GTPase
MTTAIPLTVLTGFLGSGKTTLLKRLLAHPDMAGTAVIINEFGDVGLDDALVEKVDEDAVLLASGCVCCTVRGDLVETLGRLHDRMLKGQIPPVKRVVLETTGLADPAPIVHTMMTDESVYRIYILDGVVTTVDAEHGLAQLDAHFDSNKQIAVADRIVLTKTDRADANTAVRLSGRVKAINRAVEIIPAVKGDIDPAMLFGLGAHEPAVAGSNMDRWLAMGDGGHHHHDHAHDHDHDCDAGCDHPDHHHAHLHGIGSFSLIYDQPLDANGLQLALQTLTAAYGARILRLKGILNVAAYNTPVVVHGVQHVLYPPDALEKWPSEDRRSRLVLITKDLPRETVAKHFKPFLGEVAPLQ